jgi:CubicO group peptidase (beta-lactamase class C family)
VLNVLHGRILGAQVVVMDLSGKTLCDVAAGTYSHLDMRPLTPETPIQLMEIARLPLAIAVLQHVAMGTLRLDEELGSLWPRLADPSLRALTLRQVLNHTSGCLEMLPPLSECSSLSALLDLDAILAGLEAGKPLTRGLVAPGTRQQYTHLPWVWLLVGVLRAQGLMAPLMLDHPSDPAEVYHPIQSTDAQELANMFYHLTRFVDILESKTAYADVFMNLFGRVQWLDWTTYRSEVIPGASGYGTARSVAELLQRARLPSALLAPEKAAGGAVLPESFMHFQDSTWGLGVELVGTAWGHTNRAGSFALVTRNRVVVCLLTRADGDRMEIRERILALL